MNQNDDNEFRFGPIGEHAVHICVDMQRLFEEDTPWKTPWMERVLPRVQEVAAAHAADTIFTRFIPAQHAGEGEGSWRRYWQRWSCVTLDEIGAEMADLIPSLAALVPPATVIDKKLYSPWIDGMLDIELKRRNADTLIVTGGETDVCVLATVLGAVDRGYRTILATDALCSSSDETHDALLKLYHQRYSQQVEAVTTGVILRAWTSGSGHSL